MPKWNIPAGDKNRGLAENAAVAKLVAEPGDVPELLVIRGLFGQGARQDLWRIYQNYELSEYFEVNSADIVYFEPAGNTQRVWLKKEPIRHVVRKTWTAEIDYLSGSIAAARSGEMLDGSTGEEEFGPEPTKCSQCPPPYTR